MKKKKILSLSADQRKSALDSLLDVTLLTPDYVLTLTLSVIIVVVGLLIDSASVIIGGMVVAPLLSPILALAMGVILQDFKMMKRAIKTLAISVGVIVLLAIFLTLFSSGGITEEIAERSAASLAHMIIAMSAGVLAAISLARPDVPSRLTGIAVSVALLPPISVTGIGVAFGNWELVSGSFTLFLINLLGIIFSALIVFSLMGFSRSRRDAAQILKKEEKEAEEEWNELKSKE
ncbi:MAG: TIGR00341 family protein [Patescibacteria group bacterium]|nr:TIGR00341 family protein [Patescibacteria group bacterium]